MDHRNRDKMWRSQMKMAIILSVSQIRIDIRLKSTVYSNSLIARREPRSQLHHNRITFE
ncbi:hypothetical protein AHF37_10438 [Paragonimus kellicotti]|nr:hypothetical protein AHF37_10438 [Paragonimus kellicotti]